MLFSRSANRIGRAVSPVIENLEGRCLMSATIAAGSSVLVFNSVAAGNAGAGPSNVVNLTLTDTGDAPLAFPVAGISIINDPASASADASDFIITSSSLAGIAPGASATLSLRFLASRVGVESALVQIVSNDPANPTITVPLHGIGTAGTGGGYEPSLAEILREFDIPTIVGDGPNDASAFASTYYPAVPDASSEEVPMQRLMKAGDGPVTITLLASFAVVNSPASRFGYYIPGDRTDRTELFSIGQGDSQTVNPTANGATSFDPGSGSFGLYANFPTFTDNGQQRISYSEDALNTWDVNVPRKIRFFPLRNADGSIVPNAYIFAAEDNNIPYGNIQPYDSNDIVGIIRNVEVAPTGAVFGLENLSGVPSTTQLVFNRIQNVNPVNPVGFVDSVHDTNVLRVRNTGSAPLTISSMWLSDSTNWTIVNPPAPGTQIAPGGTLDLTIKFIAQTVPPVPYSEINNYQTVNGIAPNQAGGVWNGTLTIITNDPVTPTRVVTLAGYWQNTSENENEPSLQTLANLVYGYGTDINQAIRYQLPNYDPSTPAYYGDEITTGFWQIADPTLPATVTQLASYHNQYDQTTWQPARATVGWYAQGSSSVNWLFQDQAGWAQSLLPTINGSNTKIASGSFTTTSTFAWNIDGESSDNAANTTDINTYHRTGHAVRIYPAKDANGNLIPNTFIMTMDYQNGGFDNSDFQDNVYLVTNIHPATQAPAVKDLQGVSTASGVTLEWAGVTDPTLKGYNVYKAYSPSGPWTKLNSNAFAPTSFTDFGPGSGTIYYRVAALDSAGESLGANFNLTVAAPPVVNDVLTGVDVNAQPGGSTTVVNSGKDYNLTGGGGDIGGSTADGFRWAYEQVTGDFDVQVQVTSLTNIQSGTRAGLMIRTSPNTAGDQMIFVGATASDGYRFNYRSTANATGVYQKYGSLTYPNAWVRLVRQGNTFTGYYSTDGVTWTTMQSLTMTLPATLDLGMAVCSHTNAQTATATFRHFNLTQTTNNNGGNTGGTGGGTGGNNGGGTTGGIGGDTGGTTPLTLPEQVAADRISLKDAITKRLAKLKSLRATIVADVKSYTSALRALHVAESAAKRTHQAVDPTLSDKVASLLGTLAADRSMLGGLLKSDFTGIAAAKQELAKDIAALKASKKHH
jgi:regulation of enolase protein 1 (concanavalin A-like superfamily)